MRHEWGRLSGAQPETGHDTVWREALLFVALAKIGEVFRLIAELRFWAVCGEPARVDDALTVLSDWREQHGLTWAEVLPRLTVVSRTCEHYEAMRSPDELPDWFCEICAVENWRRTFALSALVPEPHIGRDAADAMRYAHLAYGRIGREVASRPFFMLRAEDDDD